MVIMASEVYKCSVHYAPIHLMNIAEMLFGLEAGKTVEMIKSFIDVEKEDDRMCMIRYVGDQSVTRDKITSFTNCFLVINILFFLCAVSMLLCTGAMLIWYYSLPLTSPTFPFSFTDYMKYAIMEFMFEKAVKMINAIPDLRLLGVLIWTCFSAALSMLVGSVFAFISLDFQQCWLPWTAVAFYAATCAALIGSIVLFALYTASKRVWISVQVVVYLFLAINAVLCSLPIWYNASTARRRMRLQEMK